MPSPPSERSSRSLDLRKHREHRRNGVRREAHARVRDRERSPQRVVGRTRRDYRPPGSVYFAAFVSRFDRTCASRSGSAAKSTGLRRQVRCSSVWRFASMSRPRRLDRSLDDGREVGHLDAQRERAARDARDVEQVVEQQRHVLHLPADDARGSSASASSRGARRLGRSGRPGESARADCAARARASPEIHPCARRFRASASSARSRLAISRCAAS